MTGPLPPLTPWEEYVYYQAPEEIGEPTQEELMRLVPIGLLTMEAYANDTDPALSITEAVAHLDRDGLVRFTTLLFAMLSGAIGTVSELQGEPVSTYIQGIALAAAKDSK